MKKELTLSSCTEEKLEELKSRKQQRRKLSMTWRCIFSCLKMVAWQLSSGKMEHQMYRDSEAER